MLIAIAQLALASAALAAQPPQEVASVEVSSSRAVTAPIPTIWIDDAHGEGLIVVAGGQSTLADLVAAYSKLEGIRILADEQLRQMLESTPFYMYGAPQALTQHELAPFVEGVLRSSGYLLVSTGDESSYALLHDRMLHFSELAWAVVDCSGLDVMQRHPALLMQTSITLKNVDMRQLSSNLRPLLQNQWQAVIPFGNTDSLILRATGLELARFIHLVDGMEGPPAEAPPAPVEVSEAPPEPATAPAIASEAGPRPELVTRIFELSGDAQRIASTAEDLTRLRHKERYTGSQRQAEANYVPWPIPRFLEGPNTNRVLVIAAAEDFPAIEADLKWAAMLHEPKE